MVVRNIRPFYLWLNFLYKVLFYGHFQSRDVKNIFVPCVRLFIFLFPHFKLSALYVCDRVRVREFVTRLENLCLLRMVMSD